MNCQRCGGPTIPLFTSFACKAECDLKPAAPKLAPPAAPWKFFRFKEGRTIYVKTFQEASNHVHMWAPWPQKWQHSFWVGAVNRDKKMIDEALVKARAAGATIHDVSWEE